MTLTEVLAGIRLVSPIPETLRLAEIAGLEYDSRRVKSEFLFFAFPGAKTDGRQFASAALASGAVAVVSEYPAPPDFAGRWLQVEHGRKALARAARNFYDAPDARLCLTGVTGTNGKTTTTFLIDSILRHAGKTTAVIGTIEYRMAAQIRAAMNTTPESLDLYRLFHDLESLG